MPCMTLLSTLIRLLALQGICWPVMQITLSVFAHEKRLVVVWALIGTTTHASRSAQIWVSGATTRSISLFSSPYALPTSNYKARRLPHYIIRIILLSKAFQLLIIVAVNVLDRSVFECDVEVNREGIGGASLAHSNPL